MKLNTYAIALALTCLLNAPSYASHHSIDMPVDAEELKPLCAPIASQIIPGKIMNTVADASFLTMGLVAPEVMQSSPSFALAISASSLAACGVAKIGAFFLHEIDNPNPAKYDSLSGMFQHAVSGSRYIWGNIETLSAFGLATVSLMADNISPNAAYFSRLALGALGGYAFIKDFQVLNKTAPTTPASDEDA